MSRLEKLQIQGFRSFSCDDQCKQTIDFTNKDENDERVPSPLTLILGQNGCGKTTIIECLRYSTTGNFPPGSYNGRNFIHDPNMSRIPIVNAHLKMVFVGNDKKRYIVSRSVQAKKTPKSVAVKTMDSTISFRKDDGTVGSLSSKCGDINVEMARVLGVTDPILNYVIFCHQEDSNWPLNESLKVKAIFDDIFAVGRAYEGLKNIKDIRAAQINQMNQDQKDMAHYAEMKKIAKDKEKDLKRHCNTKEEIEQHLKGIDDQVEPLRDNLKEIREEELKFLGFQEKLTKANTSLEQLGNEIAFLRENLNGPEMADKSEGEIHTMKEDLAKEDRQLNDDKITLSRNLHRAREQAESEKSKLDRALAEVDQCRYRQKTHQKNCEEMKTVLASVAKELEWPAVGDAGDEKVLLEAEGNIEDTLRSFEEEKSRSLANFEASLERQQDTISSLEVRKGQLEEKKSLIMKSKIDKNKELAMTRRQLSELDGFSAKLERLKRDLKSTDVSIDNLKDSTNATELEDLIAEKSSAVQSLDKEVRSLRQELSVLSKQREVASQLSMKKDDLQQKSSLIKRIMNKANDDLEVVFAEDGGTPPLESLKSAFNKRDESLGQRKMQLEQHIFTNKARMEHEKQTVERLGDEIKTNEARIQRFKRSLGSLNSIDSFDADLEAAKSNVNDIRDELQVKEANKHTFKQFVEKMQKSLGTKDPCCPTCNRNFGSKSECEEVVAFLKEEIERVPTRVKYIQKRLDEALERQEALEKLYPEKMACLAIRDDLESRSKQLEESERNLGALRAEVGKAEKELENVALVANACAAVREDILQMDNLNKDVKVLEKSVHDLESAIGSQGMGDRGYDEVTREEQLRSQELDATRDDLDGLRSKKSKFDSDLNRLQSQRNSLFNEKLQLEAKQQDRANMEEKKGLLERDISLSEKDIKEVNSQLGPLESQIQDARRRREEISNDKVEQTNTMQRKITKIRLLQKDFDNYYGILKNYNLSRNEESLANFERDSDKLRISVKQYRDNEDHLNEKIKELEKKVLSRQTRVRFLDDNLRLKKLLAQQQSHQAEVSKLQGRLQSSDVDKVLSEKRKILEQLEQLERERSENNGRLGEMKERIKDLEAELNHTTLKKAPALYLKTYNTYMSRKYAIKDLKKVYAEFDKILMRYHQRRMATINKIIKELWRQTYKGNDIDYIEIKTDNGEVQSVDKKRSYNYRVVMIKNDTELEMRGRCSAGQKVLASLIIRLALAETFSHNCGMIALDEPTTNLDRENIESLAQALSDLVSARLNSNFQLIVITHDEDLLDFLGRVDQVSHYYKVHRNQEGSSVITRIRLSDRNF